MKLFKGIIAAVCGLFAQLHAGDQEHFFVQVHDFARLNIMAHLVLQLNGQPINTVRNQERKAIKDMRKSHKQPNLKKQKSKNNNYHRQIHRTHK